MRADVAESSGLDLTVRHAVFAVDPPAATRAGERDEAAAEKDGFPKKVTAFREGMAVHGRHRQACPRCGRAVMRIRYADSETNYCPTCQTGGKLLADRGLSRLLKGDWPRTLDALEARLRSPDEL